MVELEQYVLVMSELIGFRKRNDIFHFSFVKAIDLINILSLLLFHIVLIRLQVMETVLFEYNSS